MRTASINAADAIDDVKVAAASVAENTKAFGKDMYASIKAGAQSDKAKDLGDTALRGAAAGLGAGLMMVAIHKIFG